MTALGIVLRQAEDDGLWFYARTAPEAYLQQELRALHVAVEAEAAALRALEAEMRTDATHRRPSHPHVNAGDAVMGWADRLAALLKEHDT